VSQQVNVEEYVNELSHGWLGVEPFCAAVRQTGQEAEAEEVLRARLPEGQYVADALARLVPGQRRSLDG
jgi:hypothetical protein